MVVFVVAVAFDVVPDSLQVPGEEVMCDEHVPDAFLKRFVVFASSGHVQQLPLCQFNWRFNFKVIIANNSQQS